jgi:hypothetical protein
MENNEDLIYNNKEYKLAYCYDFKKKNKFPRRLVYIIKETKKYFYIVDVGHQFIRDIENTNLKEYEWLLNEPINLNEMCKTINYKIRLYNDDEKEKRIFIM